MLRNFQSSPLKQVKIMSWVLVTDSLVPYGLVTGRTGKTHQSGYIFTQLSIYHFILVPRVHMNQQHSEHFVHVKVSRQGEVTVSNGALALWSDNDLLPWRQVKAVCVLLLRLRSAGVVVNSFTLVWYWGQRGSSSPASHDWLDTKGSYGSMARPYPQWMRVCKRIY